MRADFLDVSTLLAPLAFQCVGTFSPQVPLLATALAGQFLDGFLGRAVARSMPGQAALVADLPVG